LSNSGKIKLATNFLEKFKVLKIGKKTGILAGQILRTKQTSYIGDALIGAVCIENEVELLTRNKKHFEKITGLKLN
jgi:predicted nucleic acid-binding protein